ncbi:MAG: hypothetical protein IJZ59_06420 [Alphaproteobacteria bacterium]|nr:hypothetical protein [Alphaproteobacteria bacterium]
MFKIVFFLIFFLINGCAFHIPNANDVIKAETTFNRDVFKRGGKSLVIIEEENNVPSSIKLHGRFTFINQEGRRFIFDVQNIGIFMLDPGTYVLENFELYGRSGYLSAHINYEKRYKAYFAVAPEDVVYIGKIKTNTIFSKTDIADMQQQKKKVITITNISEDISSLPTAFLGAIQQQTDKGLEPRLMRWVDTLITGENKNE